MFGKNWYVFDEADCFDGYETIEAAAANARGLVAGGFFGVHIVYMSEAQFNEYCKTGNLKESLKIR